MSHTHTRSLDCLVVCVLFRFKWCAHFNAKYMQTLDYDTAVKIKAVAHSICMHIHWHCIAMQRVLSVWVFLSRKKNHYRECMSTAYSENFNEWLNDADDDCCRLRPNISNTLYVHIPGITVRMFAFNCRLMHFNAHCWLMLEIIIILPRNWEWFST